MTFAAPAPTLAASCSVSPSTAATGQTVTWSASASGGTGAYTYAWSGSDSLTGSTQSVQKSYSTAGAKTASVTVTSGGTPLTVACDADANPSDGTVTVSTLPVATLQNNGPIPANTAATLTYACANSATASLSTFGSVTPVSGGTRSTGTLTQNTNYQLTCTNASGATDTKATTVVVTNAAPYLKATPDRVNQGGTSYLSWSAQGLAPSSSCTMTKNGASLAPAAPGVLTADATGIIATTTSPGVSQTIPSQTTYKLTCGTGVSTAIVNVVPGFEEF